MIVVVIGITMMNNYDKMKSMEQTLNAISRVVNEEDEKLVADWYTNDEKQEVGSIKNDDTSNSQNQTTSNEDTTNESQDVQETMNQTAIPVENVSGDVTKQEIEEISGVTETVESTGSVTEINSSEEEMQDTLDSSTQSNEESSVSENTTEEEVVTAEPQYYTVQKGETLATISMKLYNTKDMIQKICELNNIVNDNKILAGQKLLIP
jgi:LysM repeat protein